MLWQFDGPDVSDPEAFLCSVCRDYLSWSTTAITAELPGGAVAAIYARLLAPFIFAGPRLQNSPRPAFEFRPRPEDQPCGYDHTFWLDCRA